MMFEFISSSHYDNKFVIIGNMCDLVTIVDISAYKIIHQ